MAMSTPGYIGEHGLYKTREGDRKTPVGVYRFNRAFGIADDPGCAIPYIKVDEDMYWSSDSREGYHYNRLISRRDFPGLDLQNAVMEHLIGCTRQYQYCLNISYNEECIPGLGSAIFLHCFGPEKPFTAGCIAIPEDRMKFVMQRVTEDTVVVIDTCKADDTLAVSAVYFVAAGTFTRLSPPMVHGKRHSPVAPMAAGLRLSTESTL